MEKLFMSAISALVVTVIIAAVIGVYVYATALIVYLVGGYGNIISVLVFLFLIMWAVAYCEEDWL